jgi:hypothetical protein
VLFGAWHSLEQASQTAPPRPGVLQARAEQLIAFPLGKSAMVLYACSGDDEPLASFVTGAGAPLLAAASRLGARWIRYAETPRPAFNRDRLLRLFEERFGALPPANQ